MARGLFAVALTCLVAGAVALKASAFRAKTGADLDFSVADHIEHHADGVTMRGTATHFYWAVKGGGGNTCNIRDPMCVAPSDGWDALWTNALGVKTKCTNEACSGTCKSCCAKPGPGCDYDQLCTANGGHLCVRCVDSRKGYCKHNRWIKVAIADACPRYHPCNTCKGKQNPCAQGRKNVDLCDGAFYNIAKDQPDWKGLVVDVSTRLALCR